MKLGYSVYIFAWAIILNIHRATHASLIQNESYRRSPEKTKTSSEHEKRDNINIRVS